MSAFTRYWSSSVRRQLVLSVAGVHAVLMAAFIWDFTHRQQDMLREHETQQAFAVAQSMAASSTSWLTTGDVSGLQEIVEAQRKQPDLAYAMLLDARGHVLAHTDRERLGSYIRDLPAASVPHRLTTSPELLDLTMPATLDGRLIGWVRVGFDQLPMQRRLRALALSGTGYALGAIVVGVLLAWLMGTRLTERLYAIRRVTALVGSGQPRSRVPELGHDEVARLGHDFNDALDAIEERERERRAAEAARFASEQEAAATFELADVGIAHVAPDGRWLRVNQRLSAMLGYAPEELLTRSFQDITVEEDLAPDLALLEECLRGERDSYQMEKRYVAGDGRILWAQLTTKLVRRPDGSPSYFVSIVEEIDSRKKAELALRESEQRVRLLLDSTAEGIFGINHLGDCTFVNKAALRCFGYGSEADVLGRNAHQLFHHSHHDGRPYAEGECPVVRVLQTGAGVSRDDEHYWRADGTSFPVEFFARPMFARGRVVGVVVTFTDITETLRARQERDSLEAQLRQSQKMEAIGQLAGGVAHDFNNLLTAILGNAGLLQLSGDLRPGQLDLLDQIHQAGQRGATLTHRLLAFSRRQSFQSTVLDLNQIVRGMANMLDPLVGEATRLEYSLAGEPLRTRADAGMLEQVLMNLVLNARDAIPGGGSIVIRTFAAEVPSTDPRAAAFDGRAVVLEVSDSGPGIPAAHMPRLFEPFFTTKDVGRGTGLGLSIVHGIVEQHGGWIEVQSEPGAGTRFLIYLRSEGAAPADEPAEAANRGVLPRGSETILLAEDDREVRRFVVTALRQAGHEVLEAGNGPDAIRLWEEQRDRIAIAILDMVMPEGMTGMQVAERLHRDRPGLPVLVCSGHTTEDVAALSRNDHRFTFLPKPYSPAQLLEALRRLLDARA